MDNRPHYMTHEQRSILDRLNEKLREAELRFQAFKKKICSGTYHDVAGDLTADAVSIFADHNEILVTLTELGISSASVEPLRPFPQRVQAKTTDIAFARLAYYSPDFREVLVMNDCTDCLRGIPATGSDPNAYHRTQTNSLYQVEEWINDFMGRVKGVVAFLFAKIKPQPESLMTSLALMFGGNEKSELHTNDKGIFYDWTVQVGLWVDGLITDPKIRRRFLKELALWHKELRLSNAPPKKSVHPAIKLKSCIDYNSVHLIPEGRVLTRHERFSSLCAIHDQTCERAKPFRMWHWRTRPDGSLFRVWNNFDLHYYALQKKVCDLKDDDRHKSMVFDMVSFVAAELGVPNPIQRIYESKSPTPLQPVEVKKDFRGKGMPWRDATEKAEKYVKLNSFPGVTALAKIVGCSSSNMSNKIIPNSKYLDARRAEHKASKKGGPREIPMNDVILDNTPQTTEPDPQEERNVFQGLIAQSNADNEYNPSPLNDDCKTLRARRFREN